MTDKERIAELEARVKELEKRDGLILVKCDSCAENEAKIRAQLAAKSAECERLREALDFWSDPLDRSGLLALVKEHRGSESCASMTVEQFFDAREAAREEGWEQP